MKSSHNNFIIIYFSGSFVVLSRSAATRRLSVQFTMSSCRISHLPKSWHIHSSEQTLAMFLFGHTFNFSVQDQDMHERENAHRVDLALFFCVTLSHEEPNRCVVFSKLYYFVLATHQITYVSRSHIYIYISRYLLIALFTCNSTWTWLAGCWLRLMHIRYTVLYSILDMQWKSPVHCGAREKSAKSRKRQITYIWTFHKINK